MMMLDHSCKEYSQEFAAITNMHRKNDTGGDYQVEERFLFIDIL